jgi:UDP-N-acetylmuramyl pentapeptide phosphotransferase/UDP-N-acetylglucosamine-1-phosphate transferase
MLETLLAALMGLIIVLAFGPVTIASLRRLKFGLSIREEGPKEHH